MKKLVRYSEASKLQVVHFSRAAARERTLALWRREPELVVSAACCRDMFEVIDRAGNTL